MNYFSKNKKWMAYLILLTFLFTCVMPSNLSGWNSVAEAAEETDEKIAGQIEANNNTWVTPANDNRVQFRKTITAGDNENEFDIKLEVKTTQNISEIATSEKSAVILVLDVSNSMTSSNKVGSMKSAAKSFLDSYANGVTANGQRLAAVVSFSANATTLTKEDNATTIDAVWFDMNTSKGDLITKINNLGCSGGTNIDGGLRLADNIIDASTSLLAGIDDVHVILLTDGAPSRYAENNLNSFLKITGNKESWTKEDQEDKDKAVVAAGILKGNSSKRVTLYTIAFDLGASNSSGLSTNEKWLQNSIATNQSTAFESSSGLTEISNVFKVISEIIRTGAKAWIVTDKMGQYIDYDANPQSNTAVTNSSVEGYDYDSDASPNYYRYDFSEKTLTWDLRLSNSKQTTVDGTTTYYYSLTYPIRLDNTANDFPFAVVGKNTGDIPANEYAKLKYFLLEDANNADSEEEVKALLKEVSAVNPEVEGYKGSLDVTKTDINGTLLGGAEFELQYLCPAHTGNKKTNIPTGTTSSEDATLGRVTIDDIPSGHIYKLEEKTAPTGYEADAPKYAIKVSFGNVDYCKLASGDTLPETPDWAPVPETGLSFTNKKLPGEKELTVTKNWVIPNDKATTPAVKLEVLQDGQPFALDTTAQTSANVVVENGHTYVNLVAQAETSVATTVKVPKYKVDGSEYVYTVQEIVNGNAVTGETTINDEKWNVAVSGLTVTNSYIGSKTITGTKTWKDAANNSGRKQPTLIVYKGIENKENIVDSSKYQVRWDDDLSGYIIRGLDKYAVDGAAIAYIVREVAIPGYEASYVGDNITNTLTGTTSVTVEKEWKDSAVNNHNAVTVNLLANGVPVADKTVTLNSDNNWRAEFSGLAKYDENGAEISYTVKEANETNNVVTIGNNTYKVAYYYIDMYLLDITGQMVDGNKYWYYKFDVNKIYNIVPEGLECPTEEILQLLKSVLYIKHFYGSKTRKAGDEVFIEVMYKGEII